jgi:hypothetical protein
MCGAISFHYILTKNLYHDIHWDKMSKATNSQIYLFKKLKQNKSTK